MKELARLAANNLKHGEKRTYFTVIGIFIGIAAVVALISLGQGLENSINEQFEEIGANKLFVQTEQAAQFGGIGGGDVSNPLTTDDVDATERVRGVDQVASYTLRSARIQVGEDVQFNFVASVPADQQQYQVLRDLTATDLADGRELRANDRSSVIVGSDYTRSDVFLEPLRVGSRFTIDDEKFTVAGVLEPIGNSIDDRIVWMPQDSHEELFNVSETVDMIIVEVSEGENPVEVAERIERALLDERGLDEEEQDFTVDTPEDLLEQFNTILLIVRVVLTGIAGISLLVGGIGIANTMYTAVLERTKEIGIMKAIGATPRQIKAVFVLESGMLGLGGGVIGVLVGVAIAKAVEYAGRAAMGNDFLSAYLGVDLIIGSLLFSTLIGMASGWLPARQAARQDPVESLRYE